MTDFRKKAEECYATYKETSDPAEAAAADAYNEAADEIDRLMKELEKTREDRDKWHFQLQHFLVRYAKEGQK